MRLTVVRVASILPTLSILSSLALQPLLSLSLSVPSPLSFSLALSPGLFFLLVIPTCRDYFRFYPRRKNCAALATTISERMAMRSSVRTPRVLSVLSANHKPAPSGGGGGEEPRWVKIENLCSAGGDEGKPTNGDRSIRSPPSQTRWRSGLAFYRAPLAFHSRR